VVAVPSTAKDLGGLTEYVATSASGSSVWRLQDFRTGAGDIKLKLASSDTKLANMQGKFAIDVIEEYSLALQEKGYSAE
jgi:hypothetical protein